MGTQLPLPAKRGTAPNFRPMSVMAKRLESIKMPLGKKVGRPQARPHCVTRGRQPAPPSQKAHSNFWPMFVVAEQSPISATVEHSHKRSPKNHSLNLILCSSTTSLLSAGTLFPLHQISHASILTRHIQASRYILYIG